MSEIPEDILKAAEAALDDMPRRIEDVAWADIEAAIAKAMFAERERCAGLARQMPTTTGLHDVLANRIMVGWKP